jgi:hypothetical protein
MFRKLWIAMSPIALLALAAVPAAAQPAPPNLEIRIARSAPPRVRFERIPTRPDRQAVWARGYWHWEGSRWDWVSGRWNRSETAGSRWIAPRYRHEGSIWRYEPPHWSHERVVEGDEYHRWKDEHRRS